MFSYLDDFLAPLSEKGGDICEKRVYEFSDEEGYVAAVCVKPETGLSYVMQYADGSPAEKMDGTSRTLSKEEEKDLIRMAREMSGLHEKEKSHI